MPIRIFNNQNSIKVDIRKIRKHLPHIEKKMLLSKDDEYSVIFLNDRKIKRLNKNFRFADRPTDVLSFKNSPRKKNLWNGRLQATGNAANSHNKCSLEFIRGERSEADIFISIETAKDNAKFYKQDFCIEILRLIIHGILHSMDYTDYSVKAKKNMWEKQENILKCLF